MSNWSLVLLSSLFILLAACTDLPTEGQSVEEEAEATVLEALPVEQGEESEAFGLGDGASTICSAYLREFFQLENQLSERADDEILRRKTVSFKDLITHTCQ